MIFVDTSHTVCQIINNAFSTYSSVYSMYDTNQYVNLLRRDDVQVLESKHELIYKWPTGSLGLNCSQFSVIQLFLITFKLALFSPETYYFDFHSRPFLFLINKTRQLK